MALSWLPAVDTSEAEERILARCKKAKLFVFLRRHRHELFDEPSSAS
jgi:transposase